MEIGNGIKYTEEIFFQKVLEKNPKFIYEYKILGKYKNIWTWLYVQTPYGICKMQAAGIVRGHDANIRCAISYSEYWKKKAEHRWKKRFEYLHIDNFNGAYKARCRLTGEIREGLMKTHIAYRTQQEKLPKVERLRPVITYEDLVKRYGEERLNTKLYDYSDLKTKYLTQKMSITCKKHGTVFLQNIGEHLEGHKGCPDCYMPLKFLFFRKYKKELDKINGVMYVLSFRSQTETFYKVGITSWIEARLKAFRKTGYEVEVVHLEHLNMAETSRLEVSFLRSFKMFKYKPEIKFDGYTECLSENPMDHYYDWFENYIRGDEEEKGEFETLIH